MCPGMNTGTRTEVSANQIISVSSFLLADDRPLLRTCAPSMNLPAPGEYRGLSCSRPQPSTVRRRREPICLAFFVARPCREQGGARSDPQNFPIQVSLLRQAAARLVQAWAIRRVQPCLRLEWYS